MNQIQSNSEVSSNNNDPYLTPTKRKSKPRKWREIENLKAQMSLEKELREIDSDYSFSPTELM